MPNHVSQKVVFTGPAESIKKIQALLNDESNALDFQKIIPMPESLNIGKGTGTNMGKLLVEAPESITLGELIDVEDELVRRDWLVTQLVESIQALPGNSSMDFFLLAKMPMKWVIDAALAAKFEPVVHGKAAIQNLAEHGAEDWYDWSIVHWGTKWNAYSGSWELKGETVLQVCFETAWSPPAPIYEKLAGMFPDVSFSATGIDEGWGFAFEILGSEGSISDRAIACDANDEEFSALYFDIYGEYPEMDEDEDEEEETPALLH